MNIKKKPGGTNVLHVDVDETILDKDTTLEEAARSAIEQS